MKKAIWIWICIFFQLTFTYAQQKDFAWRIGASGGYSNYYGDLSPYTVKGLANWDAIRQLLLLNENYFDQYSFKISLERQLNPTVGLMFHYGEYQFSMSDRYIRRDGTLYRDNPNFNRALNFQNETRDMGLAFVFKADNDVLLSSKSILAPYFTLGFGLINFDVRGDLLDSEGNRYDYESGNVVNDGVYETELPPLNTELENGYDLSAFYTNFGLGFRLRLGNRFELFAQSDFIYTFTDYLDDVSGQYRDSYDNSFQAYAAKPGTNSVNPQNPMRGDPNKRNDWIIYHGIGLKFNFGASKKTFSASRISTYYPDYQNTNRQQPQESPEQEKNIPQEVPESEPSATPATGNIYNITNIEKGANTDRIWSKIQLMEWEQEIQKKESRIIASQIKEKTLSEIRQNIESQYELLKNDTLLNASKRDSLLELTLERRMDLRYSLDSLNRRQSELKSEIDSIGALKSNFFPGRSFQIKSQPDSVIQERSVSVIERDTVINRKKDTVQVVVQQKLLEEKTEEGEETEETKPTEESKKSETVRNEDIESLEERLSQLEKENQLLRKYQDSLLAGSEERFFLNTYNYPLSQQRSRQMELPSEQREQETERIQSRQRSPASISERNDNTIESPSSGPPADSEKSSINSAPVNMGVQQIKEAHKLALAISYALMGTNLDSKEKFEEANQEEIKSTENKTSNKESTTLVENKKPSPENVSGSNVVENEPSVKLLESKADIFFEVNQFTPAREQINKLADMVDFVKDNPAYILQLSGYSDNTGNVSYNLNLIQKRVESVANILKDQFGLDENQIRIVPGGQVVRGPNRSSHDYDRKVEVKIIPEK